MSSKPMEKSGRDTALSTLGGVIQVLSTAKDACGVPPAQIALGSACVLLTAIKDTMGNKDDFVGLGLSCAEACKALDRGLKGTESDEPSQAVIEAIDRLKATMDDIQGRVAEKNERRVVVRAFYARSDKDAIAAWKQEFSKILQIFQTELAVTTHVAVAGGRREVGEMGQEVTSMRQDISVIKERFAKKRGVTQTRSATMNTIGSSTERTHSPLGESPPPAPKAFFGRETLVEKVVALAENFEPIALVGAGGIGKTSIALKVLHHDRIKDQFGDNRRFIHCDKFTPSLPNFLARLSKVIGAGVENPEDLTPLRPFLSSNKILIVFDNAESTFDLEGVDGKEILAVVDELCQFDQICVCITSRITAIPQNCRRLKIPTLSIEAACDIFYGIYNDHERSNVIDDLLQRLEFHPLSITLLATTAARNEWSDNRLVKEWNTRRAQVLQTDTNKSLAASLQLSLDSPTFLKLGPSALDLLGVIAFFPQGINEKHLDWLFATFSDIEHTLDRFCALSLTHRTDDYITMLAPIRDHLAPRNPASSPLLCAVKDCHFSRLSICTRPGDPRFEESQWITSEDVNVEHLLNVFTSIDANTDDAWDACGDFMWHLFLRKPRKTVLGPKAECLPDDHPSKPKCLLQSSELFGRVGNQVERKRILTDVLKLNRERGDRFGIGRTLMRLSDANRWLDLYEEGIQQARESSEIFEELGDTVNHAASLNVLCAVLYQDNQLDAALAAAFRLISLNPEKILLCETHRILGLIYHKKGEKAKAIHHFETAINIASSIKSDNDLFWNHLCLADLFLDQHEFDEANSHIEEAKPYAVNDAYTMGRATQMQAEIWGGQHRLEDAKLEISHALETFETLGATADAERCRHFLRELNERRSLKAGQSIRSVRGAWYAIKGIGKSLSTSGIRFRDPSRPPNAP